MTFSFNICVWYFSQTLGQLSVICTSNILQHCCPEINYTLCQLLFLFVFECSQYLDHWEGSKRVFSWLSACYYFCAVLMLYVILFFSLYTANNLFNFFSQGICSLLFSDIFVTCLEFLSSSVPVFF